VFHTQSSQVPEDASDSGQIGFLVPFQRYKPHRFVSGIVPAGTPPGIHDVPTSSSLYWYCRILCQTGGSWLPVPSPVAGYRLVAVQAVIHKDSGYTSYEHRQEQMLEQRLVGGDYFNYSTRDEFAAHQLRVLSCLRDQFQECLPGGNPRAANTCYCFHGPRREHVESICATGLVATRTKDAGYFGSGCYSTLNIEYAVKYAHGKFDAVGNRRAPAPDGRYPVIMFAASVGMAYPVTRAVDYPVGVNQSNFFGRPLQRAFDCHVVCVSESANFQAVTRQECQYVEVVIDQVAQMLPIAVMWFEEN
jgi:hypothetical protein